MKKLQTKLFIFLLLAGKMVGAQSSTVIKNYIDQYKAIAIEEMKRTGVPASITLAQGIHETAAGQSVLVKKSNNHFGIKCKSDWTGESVSHDDDARGECFRKYADPLDSYKDHSDFLKNRPYYASLFTLDPTDYAAWAHGLKKAGYATNPRYPQILIKLIEDYNLQDYTLIAMGRKESAPAEVWASAGNKAVENDAVAKVSGPLAPVESIQNNYPAGVFKINETNVVFVPKGTPYLVVAQQHNISLARLFDFNDMERAETATADGLVFLQRKRKTGAAEFHKVLPGESLQAIAQAEGIRLQSLLEHNMLKDGAQPAAGEMLYLQRRAPVSPRLATAATQLETPSSTLDATFSGDEYLVHTVQPKETVYSIARQYAVVTDDVLKWNGLATTNIKTGQQLRINKKTANAAHKSARQNL